jgi:hypothetical protein
MHFELIGLQEDWFKDVYQISIENTNSKSNKSVPLDSRVSRTISEIINDFFKNRENVLLYVCSNADGKQEKRHSIFNRWYNSSLYKSDIVKIDLVFNTAYTTMYSTILYHNSNINSSNINSTFKNFESLFKGNE